MQQEEQNEEDFEPVAPSPKALLSSLQSKHYRFEYIESDENIVFSGVAMKISKIDTEYDEVTLAVKLDVKNDSDYADITANFQGIDKDGFEVTSFSIDGRVKRGQCATITGKEEIDNISEFEEIVAWNIEH